MDKAISVMCHSYYDANDPAPEPYYCPQDATSRQAGDTGNWHPLAQLSITEPKVSSITVRVDCLEDWEDDWYVAHLEHVDPFSNPECYGPIPDGYGEDGDEDLEPPELLRCCGQEAPKGKDASLLVRAATESGFVTIHEYVANVHPWLISLRRDILQASGDLRCGIPLPADTKFMVSVWGDSVSLFKEEQWRGDNTRNPYLEEELPLPVPESVYIPDETPVGSVVPFIHTGPLPRLLDSHYWPGL